jgi:UDP:flavonoid glycosyltransferase YjiC (YdhE family)
VSFASTDYFRDEVVDAGFRHVWIPPRWSREEFAAWMSRMMATRHPVGLVSLLYRGLAPHLVEKVRRIEAELGTHDVLVGSFLTPFLREVAHRNGIPYASAAFSHGVVPNDSRGSPPLPGLPRWTGLQRTWARLCWRLTDRVLGSTFERECSAPRRELGLGKVRGFFSDPADLVLVMVEPRLYPPPDHVYPKFHYTGACRWQAIRTAPEFDGIRRLVGDRPVPVLTFGSMGYDDPASWLGRLAAHWPSGRTLVVQSGWANFQPLPEAPWLKIVGKMPQDDLFELASVVIHHGGSGTTATALASGKPQIVVPHVAEQWHWAQEIRRLGCGVKLPRHRWPERLHAVIDSVLADASLARRAAELRPIARDDSGPARAADLLEQLAATGLARPRLQPDPPSP